MVLAALLVLALASGQGVPPEPLLPQATPGVDVLIEKARALDADRRYVEAVAVFDEAIANATRDNDVVGVAIARLYRADSLRALDRREEALNDWRVSAADFERVNNPVGQVAALGEAALLARSLGKATPEETDEQLNQLLAIARAETLRPRAMASALDGVALSCRAIANTRCAHDVWRLAEDIWRRTDPDSPQLAEVLFSHARLAIERGVLPDARDDLTDALKIFESQRHGAMAELDELLALAAKTPQAVPDDLTAEIDETRDGRAYYSGRAADAHLSLASVLTQLGEVGSAGPHVEEALEELREVPNDSETVTRALQQQGTIAKYEGDYTKAGDLYRQALERQTPGTVPYAMTLLDLAEVQRMVGDRRTARDFLENAGAIIRAAANPRPEVRSTLAITSGLLAIDDRYAEAESALKVALEIQDKEAPNLTEKAAVVSFLANVELETGQLAASRGHYLEADGIRKKLGATGIEMATIQSGLCAVERRSRHEAAAEPFCARAQAIYEEFSPQSIGAAAAWHNLALIADGRGQVRQAEERATRAWTIARAVAGTLVGDEARRSVSALIRKFGLTLMRLQLRRGATAEAFVTAEQTRAQALEALLLDGAALRTAIGEPLWTEHQTVLARLHETDLALDRAVRAQRNAAQTLAELTATATPEALQRLRADAQRTTEARVTAHDAYTVAHNDAEALWGRIRAAVPAVAMPTRTLDEARRALTPGTAFVTFISDDASIAVIAFSADRPGALTDWVVPSEPVPVAVSQAPAYSLAKFDSLRRQIEQFQELVINPDSSLDETTSVGRALFARLFPPKIAAIVRTAQRLVLSPDGMLWSVPFAALVSGAPGAPRYLGERAGITYIQSLSLLQQARERAAQPGARTAPNLLVVGVSQFATPGATGPATTRELPFAREEAAAIARLYGATPKLDQDATEAAVRRDLPSADIVHLATHGRLSDGDPMSSAVLLTPPVTPPATEPGNNGALEAWEIFAQVRLRADLVVLSGCETARGTVTQGEGIVGLTRALQYAGAASVVASQWPVADANTTTFMVAFHQSLRAGKPKDEALRIAMAARRETPATRHPFYWAPFVLLGSPDNPWGMQP